MSKIRDDEPAYIFCNAEMKKTVLIIAMIVCFIFTGCHNTTKNFGGSMTIELEPGQKLEEITWKSSDALWILSRPMREDEQPETHTFYEKSEFGLFEGTVTVVEKE